MRGRDRRPPNYDAARQQMELLPVHGWDLVSD
jgi:hypothetical protein